MKHNKYVKIGKYTKINLYVPGFPSKAFYRACRKVLEFNGKMPCITCLISVTSACRYNCPHCYQKFDQGKDVDINILVQTVKKLQDKGIAFFNIEGGEPFLVFDRLLKVCNAIDDRSEILINSTGDGMTLENLTALNDRKNLLGIMFSLHSDSSDKLNHFMGTDKAWENLENGIQLCHQVGIPVTFNTCLLKEAFCDGTFEKILEVSRNFNGAILQLIKPKPAGGWLDKSLDKFTPEDTEQLLAKVDDYNLKSKHKRDTAIYAMIREESKDFFGCTAGATDRFYINAKGDLQPCEFLNISFGNIQNDDFEVIYNKMRTVFEKPSSCLLCEKYANSVFELKRSNKLKSLPLPPDISEELYAGWEREGVVEFYDKINNL
ncbi:radical SAM/SPASM domain-containing protein [Mangrovibacterium lignilyticum]|uniref:radical SAM/SPASM domain-containing protein n=1 Tax=Mangrovibacterium lignilyticum TaxID=2668052 RepID=UPI0019689CAA|nr:radical SAM protein [Mangrovibacterium lignilyticum]